MHYINDPHVFIRMKKMSNTGMTLVLLISIVTVTYTLETGKTISDISDIFKEGRIRFNEICAKESVFLKLYGISVIECNNECNSRKKCRAFNYNRHFHLCELISSIVLPSTNVGSGSVPTSTDSAIVGTDVVDCIGIVHVEKYSEWSGTEACEKCNMKEVCNHVNGSCNIKECPAISAPDNTMVMGNQLFVGSKRRYACVRGYTTMKHQETYQMLGCQDSGTFGPELEPCVAVSSMQCPSLVDPPSGTVNTSDGLSVGNKAHYGCDTCYSLNGDSKRECLASGEWSGSAPTCQATVPGYILVYNNSCYKWDDGSYNWLEAQDICNEEGAYLAEINSAGENSAIKSWLKGSNDVWIGLNDLDLEGSMIWSNSQATPSFEDWHPDEPNNGPDDKGDCVRLDASESYQWRDSNCNSRMGFICEHEHS